MVLIKLLAFAALITILSFFAGHFAAAQTVPVVGTRVIKVAVLDTGANSLTGAPMCESGHIDFSGTDSTSDSNHESHGSNIAALIAQEAGPTGYCLIIIKIFNAHGMPVGASEAALKYVASLKPDIINLSWGGTREYPEETAAIKTLLKMGVRVNAAAGNRAFNLDVVCNFYPGCIPGVTMIGNSGPNSNYGRRVDVVINGNHKLGGGSDLSGSSQSTALYTGRLIRQMLEAR